MAVSPKRNTAATDEDHRFMAAAIRLSRRHTGLTGTNPSVATLVVDAEGIIVGRGVTAVGGRPHAETEALAEAGSRARGATAYVTLEPCAHHGRTPPCAEAVAAAGIGRVVGAAFDPDERVSGKGYAILRDAGVQVTENVLADEAADVMAGYLIRSVKKRPEVILKFAVSRDGMIGRLGEGQVAITGPEARARAHLLRAGVDAILVGAGTARADDPELTCRLPGLETRSPVRIVLGGKAPPERGSRLVETIAQALLWWAPGAGSAPAHQPSPASGIRTLATEVHEGKVALPELLEDLAAQGIMSVLVEGGAAVANAFLRENLVDRIVLFEAPMAIGKGGIVSPIVADTVPGGFGLLREEKLGQDICLEWRRLPKGSN